MSDNTMTVVVLFIGIVIAMVSCAVTCSNYTHCNGGVMVKTMWGTYDCVPSGR